MPAFVTYPGHTFYEAYLAVRYDVLRAPLGLPPGSEVDASDGLPSTRHLVWAEEDVALGCVQLQARAEGGWAQVRFMAVRPEAQGQGIGAFLLNYLEQLAAEEGYTDLTLNAREQAVGFYRRLGYTQHEEIAPFYGIRHWRMTKSLLAGV